MSQTLNTPTALPTPTAQDVPAAEARLSIHATANPAGNGKYLTHTLQWLRGLYPAGETARPGPNAVLRLEIDDLQGRRVFSQDAAGPLVELSLPEGTYNVTAIHGHVCRGYTLTLEPGKSFDLYLCPSLKSGCR
ncbi:hypothetical protein SAMN05216303_11021 [Rhodoferax sp. OV413]|uniref:hypothetical protein n=1 Tax=Rhodoferax sp. OV413 TaxID=1855285 RepID=UPI00088A9391|nr:hypothetical protein [Rhodoferax sp. OV413]SDP91550.1 hypothetical protein SAMN05216303_11021 [Rhodoferax sp. OV413]